MARPKYADGDATVKQQLEDALFELLFEKPLDSITVSELTKEVDCNRGAFYYHFESIRQLAESVLEKTVPRQIPQAMFLTYFSGVLDVQKPFVNMQPLLEISIHRDELITIGRLLNGPNGMFVQRIIKQTILDYMKEFPALWDIYRNPESRIVFEFAQGGIMNMLAYLGTDRCAIDLTDVAAILFPEIPEALASCLGKSAL